METMTNYVYHAVERSLSKSTRAALHSGKTVKLYVELDKPLKRWGKTLEIVVKGTKVLENNLLECTEDWWETPEYAAMIAIWHFVGINGRENIVRKDSHILECPVFSNYVVDAMTNQELNAYMADIPWHFSNRVLDEMDGREVDEYCKYMQDAGKMYRR